MNPFATRCARSPFIRTLSAVLAGASASSSSAQTAAATKPPATDRLLLIGLPARHLVDVPGVGGRLGLEPAIPCPASFGSSAGAQLRALRGARDLAPLGAIHYQVLAREPGRGTTVLSDVMRLPVGTDGEATVCLRTGGGGGATPATSEISYPTVATVEITLASEPDHTLWTRYLSFTNYANVVKRVPIDFARKAGLTWAGTVDAAALATLQSLADVGSRSHWDNMKLENRGGTTELRIARLAVVLHYEKGSHYEEDIPIVASTLNRTLAAGTASIDLDAYATAARKAWAGIAGSMHQVVQLAAADFGKSGSDGTDAYPSNPKFGGSDNNLCSEFVSWYFHQAGLVIDGEDFEDIVTTSQIDAAFTGAGRRYDYNNASQAWIHSASSARYTPQPGDFLARRYDGEYEHSMIVLAWDDPSKTMTVINGPWPVTLRYVEIQELEEAGYDFRVGRIR